MITPFNYTFSIRPRYLLLFLTVTCLFANSVTIRGIVRNPAGKPVKKASVTLRNMKDEIVVDEKTNRKGNFILEDVDPNFYFLLFENEGDGSKRIKINPRKTKNKDLVLTIELNGEDYGWNREGENVGKYRIVLVQMGKVIVESNRKTIVLVMLKDTQFENEL